MQMTRGTVPHFSMKPHPMMLGGFFLVLIVGGLLALSFFVKDEGAGDYRMRGVLVLMITGLISFFLLILMTAKLWFPHLWKKNSTHARHKQHSAYHPSNRNGPRRDQGRSGR